MSKDFSSAKGACQIVLKHAMENGYTCLVAFKKGDDYNMMIGSGNTDRDARLEEAKHIAKDPMINHLRMDIDIDHEENNTENNKLLCEDAK